MPSFRWQTIICVLVLAEKVHCFTSKNSNQQISTTRPPYFALGSSVVRNGEDARWNPAQASEFLTWHIEDAEKAGLQLAPLIKEWSGSDVGEFLTRMYLGEVNQEEYTISYHPSNVRNPQWRGLGEDGLRYLALFMMKALPTKALTPREVTRFADYFLLKEHKWPATKSEGNRIPVDDAFESDSFAGRGHSADIARVIGYIRKERLGDFSSDDVIALLTLPEEEDKNRLLLRLNDFFGNIGIKLTSMEKIMTVEALAVHGCSPGLIARVVSCIEEISEEARVASTERAKSLEEAQSLQKETEKAQAFASAESISSPVKTPISEILSSESQALGLVEFETSWLPEELLVEDSTTKVAEQ